MFWKLWRRERRLPLPRIKPRFVDRLSRCPVAIPTKIFRLCSVKNRFQERLGPKKGEVISNGNKYIFEELGNFNLSRTVVNAIKSKKLGTGGAWIKVGDMGSSFFEALRQKVIWKTKT